LDRVQVGFDLSSTALRTHNLADKQLLQTPQRIKVVQIIPQLGEQFMSAVE
jgi:hypothetical protein